MATTSPDNIWSPDSGDDYALTVDLAAMADTVQDAITSVRSSVSYRSDLTDAQRLALSGGSLTEGLTVRTTDTKRTWIYTSGAWISADTGMYLITPTSGNLLNASVASDGTINLSGAAGAWCEIRNVFTTRFRNYLVLYTISGSATSAGLMQFMTNSSRDTSASYGNARAYITSGGAYTPAYNSGETSGRLIAVNTSGSMSGKLAISDPTDAGNNSTGIWDTMGGGLPSNGGINAAVSAHNGIAFQRNAGTTTGYVKIYGYA